MKKTKYIAVTFSTPQQLYKALYSGRVIQAIALDTTTLLPARLPCRIMLYEKDCKICPEGVDVAEVFYESTHFTEVIEEEVHWEDSLGTDKYKNGILCDVWDDVRASMGRYDNIAEVDASGGYHTVNGTWWGNARPITKEEALSMVYTEEEPITGGRPWHKGGHITGYE